MRRRQTRAIAGACLAAVALGACGDNGQAAADVETTEPTVRQAESPAPTPTPPPEPVTQPSEPLEIPEPDLTIESEADVEKVVNEILAFRDWLYANPWQSRSLSSVYWPECACAANLRSQLTELAEAGARINHTSATSSIDVQVLGKTEASYDVRVKWLAGAAELVGADGEVISERAAPTEPQDETWVLIWTEDRGFRLRTAASR